MHRLDRADGRQVRQRRSQKQRLARCGEQMTALLRPNQRWSIDFVQDQLAEDRTLRLLTIVGASTRAGR
ncbi:MAG: hypothetical protein PHQ04_12620 [Opitutaceae bacterium]|nr:hypothetical protein [Opitutaceae bacterium]